MPFASVAAQRKAEMNEICKNTDTLNKFNFVYAKMDGELETHVTHLCSGAGFTQTNTLRTTLTNKYTFA